MPEPKPFVIRNNGILTDIEVDGHPVKMVYEIEFRQDAHRIPDLTLRYHAFGIEVQGEAHVARLLSGEQFDESDIAAIRAAGLVGIADRLARALEIPNA